MEKQRWEESRRRRKEVRRSEKRKREKKEDAGARKGRKVAIHCVFLQWFVAQEGPKVGSQKRRVRSQREAHFKANGQNTSASDHFWKLRCRKSARRCGAKHISKSKCTKHTMFGPLLEVEMPKKCSAQTTFPRQNAQSTQGSDHFWQLRCRKSARLCGAKHVSKSKCKNTTCSDHFLTFRCRKSAH